MSVVTIERKILEKNDEIAGRNRLFFKERGIFVVNIVSSPGSGKTSILECTLERLKGKVRLAVIEGDVQTDLDARRIIRHQVPAVQIVTRGGCHLEANLVRDALEKLDTTALQFLVIENVGNLVCPANYDLGEDRKIVVVSTTEGDDKPLKYPAMFRNAGVLIINKIDLLPYVNCDIHRLRENARAVNPALRIFETSCTTNEGIGEWCDWILTQIAPAD
ncbi:MAG TPA: hydrogenase nickel incorporation protein HypB [Bacteroidota bacterium]|nr:hydrogenase nickel incorporation protein HypB [Bacteroidota bacterium]